ncbi:MAG: helix-turn-helix domain-containing protein [Alphaproteobacteria bacterium]|nr:helix-turn-helix domain-containing protein [Alphaproteobacteria bacterium]
MATPPQHDFVGEFTIMRALCVWQLDTWLGSIVRGASRHDGIRDKLARKDRRSPVFARRDAPETQQTISTVLIARDSSDLCRMIKDRSPPHSPERKPQQLGDPHDPNREQKVPSDDAVSFHREKFRWLDQLRADPELTPLAFLLAYVLADLVNAQRGYAWPSIARLASECRVTERGVQKIIRRLVECGHLSVELGQGRRETNHYRWIIKDPESAHRGERQAADTMRTQLPENETQGSLSSRKGRTPVHPNPSQRVNHGSEKGEQPFQKGRTAVHPTQSNESIYDPLYRSSSENAARRPPTDSKLALQCIMPATETATFLGTRQIPPPGAPIRVGQMRPRAARHSQRPVSVNRACSIDRRSDSFMTKRISTRFLRASCNEERIEADHGRTHAHRIDACRRWPAPRRTGRSSTAGAIRAACRSRENPAPYRRRRAWRVDAHQITRSSSSRRRASARPHPSRTIAGERKPPRMGRRSVPCAGRQGRPESALPAADGHARRLSARNGSERPDLCRRSNSGVWRHSPLARDPCRRNPPHLAQGPLSAHHR